MPPRVRHAVRHADPDPDRGSDAATARTKANEAADEATTTTNTGGDIEIAVDMTVQPLPAGTVLANRYEIQRPLGRGGMGAIYLALALHFAWQSLNPGDLWRCGHHD